MKILFPSAGILVFLVDSGISTFERKTCESVASTNSDWPSDYCDTWKKRCKTLNDMDDFDRVKERGLNGDSVEVLAKELSAGAMLPVVSGWICKLGQFSGSCDPKHVYKKPIDCVKKMDGQMLDVLIGERRCDFDDYRPWMNSNSACIPIPGIDPIGADFISLKDPGFNSNTKVLHFNQHSDKAKCSSKKSCDITAFRISCESDYYNPNEKYAGVIIYDAGTYNKGRKWGRIYPGYTMLFNTKNMKTSSSKSERAVIDWVIRKRFGNVLEAMEDNHKMKFGGFSVQNGVLKIGSSSMIKGENWNKGNRNMGTQEAYIIHSLVNFWKTKNRIAVNIPVDQLYLYRPQQINWTIKNEPTYDTNYKLN